MTRVKELTEAGINVSFGHDDIFDPWYPMGNGSLRDVVFMGLHVAQMMGYPEPQCTGDSVLQRRPEDRRSAAGICVGSVLTPSATAYDCERVQHTV